MHRQHGLWLVLAVASAHPARSPAGLPSRVSKTAPLLDSYRFGTVSTYTTVDQVDANIASTADWKRRVGETVDETGAVPPYVRSAASQARRIVPGADFRVEEDYYVGTNGVGHVHFQQIIDGTDVDTAHLKINLFEDGTVLSYGHSFILDTSDVFAGTNFTKRDEGTITPLAAFESAVKLLDLPITGVASAAAEKLDGEAYTIKQVEGCVTDPTAKLVYVRQDNAIVLAWRVETDFGSNWIVSYVDAASGTEIAGVSEYKNNASYEAFPWGTANPDDGSRELVVDPEDTAASPLGWHTDGTQNYTTLRGNNAFVTIGERTSDKAVATSPSLIFSYPYSPATADWQTYVNASATQAFFTINKFHDILYTLGFDEAAGNFQASNNGRGGVGGDPVEIIIHTGGSATMTLGVDGRSPRLSMGVWQGAATPQRDSVFDTTVLLHEYTHGVTSRLVGGPATSGCLGGNDGLSLSEGYSDLVPILLRVAAGATRATDYTIADWATGTAIGLRAHFVSTSLATTPLTFASLNALSATGGFDLATVWATALYEVFWNLVDAFGGGDGGVGEVDEVALDAAGVPQGARYYLLKLILDSDALVPCDPHHLQARDAILQADRVLSGGANRCAIWKGFAKRGFGEDAVRGSGPDTRVDGFSVPAGC